MTPREVPARTLAVPTTASPELQRSIAALALIPRELFLRVPRTAEQWRAMVAANNGVGLERLAQVKARFNPTIDLMEIGGVGVREVVPAETDPGKAHRLLIHLHGGAYVINGGEVGVIEAILAASHAGAKVLSVDYRMPPDHPFPRR